MMVIIVDPPMTTSISASISASVHVVLWSSNSNRGKRHCKKGDFDHDGDMR